jgi:hypothetical protein
MGIVTCCSIPRLRREKSPQARRQQRSISPMPRPLVSPSRSPSPLSGALPPIASSPFKLSPFKTSPSPVPSPERRVSVASSVAFRRPSSTLAPSPRYLARDTSRFSSFETAPLARSSPGLTHQDVVLVACEIWEEAYDQVRNDETLKPLVKNYEELFRIVASDSSSGCGSRRSSRAKKEPLSDDDEYVGPGAEYFTRLAQEYLDLARRDAANQGIVSSAVQFIQKTRDAVSLALVSSPPASIAWTGICTIVLPVCAPSSVHLPFLPAC